MPKGTEIPSSEISPANCYSRQHHPYPRNFDMSQSLYLGTRVDEGRIPDRSTGPYPTLTENKNRHAWGPVQQKHPICVTFIPQVTTILSITPSHGIFHNSSCFCHSAKVYFSFVSCSGHMLILGHQKEARWHIGMSTASHRGGPSSTPGWGIIYMP